MGDVLLALVLLAVTIWAVIDAIQTEDSQVLFLPKLIWILLILLFPTVGAIAWFCTGRQRGPRSGRRGSNYPAAPRGPDDDPDFLRNL
jgi:hypothetical protein